MPPSRGATPSRAEMLAYLAAYEAHYQLHIQRPIIVQAVGRAGNDLQVKSDVGIFHTRAVVSATGTWRKPFIPDYAGRLRFRGHQLHAVQYRSPEPFHD